MIKTDGVDRVHQHLQSLDSQLGTFHSVTFGNFDLLMITIF